MSGMSDQATFVTRLRASIGQSVVGLTSGSGPLIDYTSPLGDPGLFGPDAACWKVHSDFPSMMTGGISALLLQTLHPLALAGVWDHSTFRTDILGRLRRTATFVACTTYGNRADALSLIERVKHIHLGVTGVAPDGRAYRASDPDLLTWVHVAEVSSFLKAYLRFKDPAFSSVDQDRYFDETATIARMLGARDVPTTRAAIEEYLEAMRPQLQASARTREVLNVLKHAPTPSIFMKPASRMLFSAGVDLLPEWAQQALGLGSMKPARRIIANPGVKVVASVVRWGYTNTVSKRALKRVTTPTSTD
jgi:uncharacterized protein (DUF2236 family)